MFHVKHLEVQGSTRNCLPDNSESGSDVVSVSSRGWHTEEEAALLDVSRETSRSARFNVVELFHVKHWAEKGIAHETFHVKHPCEYLLRCFT